MTQSTKDVIENRASVYGDYALGVTLEAELLNLIETNYYNNNKAVMPHVHRLLISKIIMKLSRISVTTDHIDSWVDIAGYAELTVKFLENEGLKNSCLHSFKS